VESEDIDGRGVGEESMVGCFDVFVAAG